MARAKKRKPRRKKRNVKKGFDVVLEVAKGIGALSVIYGVAFGIYQYNDAKQEKRVEQSLSLFRQFNNAPFTQYRTKINDSLLNNSEKIYNAASNVDQLTTTMATIVRNDKIATDLVLVMDFFDGVAYCAAKRICDPGISYDLFYARGRELYVTFYQYIKAQRNSFAGNDFGAGLETLVKYKPPEKIDAPQANVAAK